MNTKTSTVLTALASARKVANENGFGDVDAVAVGFWGHYKDEEKWRVGFVRPCDSGEHDLEYWIVLLDLASDETSIRHGFDLPFPRSEGKHSHNYRLPWPSSFEVSIDDAIQIAASARNERCLGPRELGDIGGVCFEQEVQYQGREMRDQWDVVFTFEWDEDIWPGRVDACVFFIDIHSGNRLLLPIGYPGV